MKKKKIKRRLVILSCVYIAIGIVLIENIASTSYQIYQKFIEKRDLTNEISKLKEEEEELNGTVTKLQDPDYVARYAREKYLYSKDGEIIIRIPD